MPSEAGALPDPQWAVAFGALTEAIERRCEDRRAWANEVGRALVGLQGPLQSGATMLSDETAIGRDPPDVIVTDGVVGNVMIKLAEGLSEGIFKAIAREVRAIDPDLATRFEPIVQKIYAEHDYHEYGGAPLLGVNGVCLISHGSSVARTITNAVLRSKLFFESGVNQAITERLAVVEEAVA